MRWSCWSLSSYPCLDYIFRRCSNVALVRLSAPDDHFTASPDRRMKVSRGQAHWRSSWLSSYRWRDRISRQCSRRLNCRSPPQTIISLPVHTAVCSSRLQARRQLLVGIQLFVVGLYLPPVFITLTLPSSAPDDHFTASPHGCVRGSRQSGALVVLVAVQLLVPGLYLPPVLKIAGRSHSRPKRSFHCRSRLPYESRAAGALVVLVAVQLLVLGLYLPPVFKSVE